VPQQTGSQENDILEDVEEVLRDACTCSAQARNYPRLRRDLEVGGGKARSHHVALVHPLLNLFPRLLYHGHECIGARYCRQLFLSLLLLSLDERTLVVK
jgi:hypothetical protein